MKKNFNKRYLLRYVSLVLLSLWGGFQSYNINRYPAGTSDVSVVGPKGEVTLFYKDGHHIAIKRCKDFTILQEDSDWKNDCEIKPESRIQRVPLSSVKNHLKIALSLPYGNYDIETKKKIETYNSNSYDHNIQNLLEDSDFLKAEIKKIEGFIEKYGGTTGSFNDLNSLRQDLSQVEGRLENDFPSYKIVKKINKYIDNLVDKIIDNDKLHQFSISNHKTNFVFNILGALARVPLLSATFVKILKDKLMIRSSRVKTSTSKSFEIMNTEVTQMQWFLVMGWNPSKFNKKQYCLEDYNEELGLCPNHPVENVSWNEVKLFIKQLNSVYRDGKCEGTSSDSRGCYRLPTEAEWKYAARGGTSTIYFFGNNASILPAYGWFNDNSGEQTHRVGLKKNNAYGLYDMHGNVWEWVEDSLYQRKLKGGIESLQNFKFLTKHIVFGGSWSSGEQQLNSMSQAKVHGGSSESNVGFRLVKTL